MTEVNNEWRAFCEIYKIYEISEVEQVEDEETVSN